MLLNACYIVPVKSSALETSLSLLKKGIEKCERGVKDVSPRNCAFLLPFYRRMEGESPYGSMLFNVGSLYNQKPFRPIGCTCHTSGNTALEIGLYHQKKWPWFPALKGLSSGTCIIAAFMAFLLNKYLFWWESEITLALTKTWLGLLLSFLEVSVAQQEELCERWRLPPNPLAVV